MNIQQKLISPEILEQLFKDKLFYIVVPRQRSRMNTKEIQTFDQGRMLESNMF